MATKSPMPWFMDVTRTCKVLNRIANRTFTKHASPTLVSEVMDFYTTALWDKVDNYYHAKGVNL